jgi:GT2 family glycosyltransferase
MAKKLDLSIIILNYNGLFWLKKLLPTLEKYYLKTSKYKVEVIVVDNASEDDSVKFLQKNMPWVKVLESGKNAGFAFGNNVALRYSRARYVMSLNSDTEFVAEKSNLDILINYLDKNRRVAATGPRLELSNGQLDPASHRGEPHPWAAISYFLGLENLFPNSKFFAQYHLGHLDLESIHPVDAISGAAMMVRQTVIKKVGLLDENFFMYGEDLDWCRRFRDANYQVIFNPQVTIIHHKYKSGIKSINKKTAKKTHRFFYNAMLTYYDKYYAAKYPNFIRRILRSYIFVKRDGR